MKKIKQTLSILISYTLIFMPLHAAELQTDGTTNTALDSARNGVPVVNIANPNSTGLSHNKFKEYNVAKEGLILNNSRDTTVNTQLGGYIYGNSNLSSNAKVILNEVTSSSRSQLSGYTEVAGQRADLVIANPNGLTINGAGFINTSNITLTTGTPLINNGAINSFNVLGGDITVEGDGLDTSAQDSTHIYTHYLKVNAAIHAQNLDVKIGKLDSSALGGMYANRISLIGTEQGLGVNLPPEVLASSGDITITNDGRISLGSLNAQENININSNEEIELGDTVLGNNIEIVADTIDNRDVVVSAKNDLSLEVTNIVNNGLLNSTNNLTITSDNLTNNRTIFSGNDMFLHTKGTLLNSEDANIFAVNNLTMAADEFNAKTNQIINNNANIQTLNGDIDIWANNFINQGSSDIHYTTYYYNLGNANKYTSLSSAKTLDLRYDTGWESRSHHASNEWRGAVRNKLRAGAPLLYNTIQGSITNTTFVAIETRLDNTATTTDPSILESGHNLNIHVDDFLNRDATVVASNDIYLDVVNSFLNVPSKESVNVSDYKYHVHVVTDSKKNLKGKHYRHSSNNSAKYITLSATEDATATSLIQAGNSIIGTTDKLINDGGVDKVGGFNQTNNPVVDNVNSQIIEVPTDNNGLFIQSPNSNSDYLIETNPELTLYKNFISSDYMMEHIDYDAEATTKRLGDAFYENTLIRDSIFAQTGRKFLNSELTSNYEQFKYLMDNAIQASENLELTPGLSLNKEQINALSKDIVWMEEQIVQGEKVLVPVVYLANLKRFEIQDAKIIAGKSIDLDVKSLENSGSIIAGSHIDINANDSIANSDGVISADEGVRLLAVNDITNRSATIKAKNVDIRSTDGSIINQRATAQSSFNEGKVSDKTTMMGNASNIQATNTLNINAAKDITVEASELNAKDINLNAKSVDIITTVAKNNLFAGDSKNYVKEQSTTHLASNLNADNINISSRETTTIKGSNLNAAENLNVRAKEIDVLAVNNSSYKETKTSSSGFLSKRSTIDMKLNETTQSSKLSSNNLVLESQKDISLESVNINANNSAQIVSQEGDVNFLAKSYTNASHHETKKSRFGGLIASRSVDSISETKLTDSATKAENTIVVGGKNINIVATELKTNGGGIRLSAIKNVNIISGLEEKSEQHIRESTGLKLKLDGSKFTYAQTIKDSADDKEISNKSSKIETDNLIIESGEDTNIIASNIGTNSMNVNAQRDFNVLSDRDVSISDKKHSKKELGFELTLNKEEASLFAGYWENEDGKKSRESQVVSSNINARNLEVSSQSTNVVGSNITGENIKINSENIRALSDSTNSNTDAYTKSIKAGVEVGVKQNLSNAIDAIDSVGDAQSNSAVVARGLRAYDALQSFVTKPVTAGVNAIYEEERTDTHNTNTQAVASRIIATDTLTLNAIDELEVAGSDLASGNTLRVDANNINIYSSESRYSVESSNETKNATLGLYGTNLGEATVGFQNNDHDTTGTRQRNSQVYAGGTASITSREDTTLAGANIQARNLELNVGGDLNMQSLQDMQTIDGSSRGGSISGNVMTGVPSGISANVGETTGERAWVSQTTGINASESMRVNVGDTTTLTGASITNLNEDGQEQNNLEVNTQHLVVSDIKDVDTYDATTAGISIGQNNNAPSLSSVEYTNNTRDKEQVTRATIGSGTVNTESITGTLNRDTTNIQEITRDESSNLELYGSNHTVALLENPEDAISDLSNRIGDIGLASHVEILENLPSASKEGDGEGDFIDSAVGALVDAGGEWAFGVIPTVKNDGGYVTQIATQLFGDNREIIVANDTKQFEKWNLKAKDQENPNKDWDYESYTTVEGKIQYRTNPDKRVRIDESVNSNDPLSNYKIHLTSQDIKDAKINSIFTNGLNNLAEEAIDNQQGQQANPNIGIVNYNTSHGTLVDLFIETGLEKSTIALDTLPGVQELGYIINGSARQTGDSINQLVQINRGNINIAAHSQGTQQTYLGLQQHKEEIAQMLKENPNSVLTLQNSGSPVSSKAVENLVVNDLYGGESEIKVHTGTNDVVSVFRSQINPGDSIGLLGGNFGGINNNAPMTSGDFWDQAGYTITRGVPTLMNGSLQNNQSDPTKTSPHSGYPCVIGCGDNGRTTNDIKFYFDVPTQKDMPLFQYYQKIEVEPSKAKFNTGNN